MKQRSSFSVDTRIHGLTVYRVKWTVNGGIQ